MLLQPQLGQSGRGVGFVVAHRHEATDVVGGDALAVDLIAIGVKAEALPQPCLLQVAVDVEPEHAVIFAALVDASAVGEDLSEIHAAGPDSHIGEGLAHPGHVDRRDYVIGDAVLAHPTIGARRIRQRQ